MPRTSSSKQRKNTTDKSSNKNPPSKTVAVRWKTNIDDAQDKGAEEPKELKPSRHVSTTRKRSILKNKSKLSKANSKNPLKKNALAKRKRGQLAPIKAEGTFQQPRAKVVSPMIPPSQQKLEDANVMDKKHKLTPSFHYTDHRALAVDTRILKTFDGDAVGSCFINTILSFMKLCARRGALPKYLATPSACVNIKDDQKANSEKQSVPTIQARVADLPLDELMKDGGTDISHNVWKSMLTPVQVILKSSSVLPKCLEAKNSWQLFSDLGKYTFIKS